VSNLLGLLTAGERNVQALADPGTLRWVAEQISSHARERGITDLVAASPAAERIVGAAVVMARASRQSRAGVEGLGQAVLVVDVNLASGTAMAETARRLRQSGAGQVDGVVLHVLGDAVGPQECGLDTLEVLQPSGAFRSQTARVR
jgi:predicted phosphoribosyltransferase